MSKSILKAGGSTRHSQLFPFEKYPPGPGARTSFLHYLQGLFTLSPDQLEMVAHMSNNCMLARATEPQWTLVKKKLEQITNPRENGRQSCLIDWNRSPSWPPWKSKAILKKDRRKSFNLKIFRGKFWDRNFSKMFHWKLYENWKFLRSKKIERFNFPQMFEIEKIENFHWKLYEYEKCWVRKFSKIFKIFSLKFFSSTDFLLT